MGRDRTRVGGSTDALPSYLTHYHLGLCLYFSALLTHYHLGLCFYFSALIHLSFVDFSLIQRRLWTNDSENFISWMGGTVCRLRRGRRVVQRVTRCRRRCCIGHISSIQGSAGRTNVRVCRFTAHPLLTSDLKTRTQVRNAANKVNCVEAAEEERTKKRGGSRRRMHLVPQSG